jgi:uncharacterized repeat protein (TIGR02543 family)
LQIWNFESDTVQADTILYAKWGYEVLFDSNGGSKVASIITDCNSLINAPINPTKTGYTFAGWYLDSNFTGSAVSFPYSVTSNVTLYAKWNVIDNTLPIVTFETNGGTAVNSINAASINDLPLTTKDGYSFEGWYSNSALSGNAITFPYTVASNITLYAKWSQNNANTYTVTFNTNGGTTIQDFVGNNITTSPVTTLTGYTFSGWYTTSDFTGSAVIFPYTVTTNITFYAKWNVSDPAYVTLMTEYYNSLNSYEAPSFVLGNATNSQLYKTMKKATKSLHTILSL